MPKRKYADWVVIDSQTGEWKCLRCGQVRTTKQVNAMLPLSIDGFCKLLEAFSVSHKHCQEPQPQPTDAVMGGSNGCL